MKKLLVIILILIASPLMAQIGGSPITPPIGGNVATDTIFDAAGDLIQGTGANTAAKLTKGAEGTILRAGATSNAYTPYAVPATVPTVGKVLISDGTNLIGSTALGTAAYTESTAYAPSSSIALTALANQAAYTLVGNLTAGAAAPTAIAPVNNGVFGCNSAGVCAYYTTISMDGSAAQFYDATAPTKLFWIDPQYMTTGKTFKFQPTAADDYTVKVTATGNTDITLPTSGTVATVKTEKLAVFNFPGDADDGTKIDSYIPVASTITGWIITTNGAACSAVVDIWGQAYADFPPEVGNTIITSEKPTLSSAQMNKDTSISSSWTEAVAADTILRANLDSSDCAAGTTIQVTLIGTK